MATTPDNIVPNEAVPAAAVPKAVAAVAEAAPVAVAAVVETVAGAAPAARRAIGKVAARAKRAAGAAPAPVGPAARTARPAKIIAAVKAAVQPKGKTMNDTIDTVTAKGEQLFADLKTRAEGSVAKGQQFVSELNDFNKGTVEAIVESSKIAAKGFEKLGQDAAEYTRRSFEQTTTAFKTMASVKSPTELMKLQNDYVRSAFDMMVAETSRSTEAMLKLAGEVAQPISNRMAIAAEKVKLAA